MSVIQIQNYLHIDFCGNLSYNVSGDCMNVFFSKCSDAIESANRGIGFGCFYSEKNDENRDIHLHECCEILF